MATFNTLSCVTGARNTGISACSFDPKNIVGAFLCPQGFVIPAAQLGALQTFLVAQTEMDNKASRIFPFFNFIDFKDESEAPVVEKFGFGPQVTVRDGSNTWVARFRKGGQNLLNRLRAFNGDAWSFLFIDSKNQIIGTSTVDGTGAAAIGAIPSIEFYAQPSKVNDGKKSTEYWAAFTFLPKYVNELVGYITDAPFDVVSGVPGLLDVTIVGTADATTGVYHLQAYAGDSQLNLANLFPTAILTIANWAITAAATAAAIVPSAIILDPTLGGVKITLPTVAPPYPVSGKINFSLVGPTELAAGLMAGFECVTPAAITKN